MRTKKLNCLHLKTLGQRKNQTNKWAKKRTPQLSKSVVSLLIVFL